MKATQLKSLKIDLEGRLTFDGEVVNAIPIGRPQCIPQDTQGRMRREGRIIYGFYQYLIKLKVLPERANAYTLGEHGIDTYLPIQFYRIK